MKEIILECKRLVVLNASGPIHADANGVYEYDENVIEETTPWRPVFKHVFNEERVNRGIEEVYIFWDTDNLWAIGPALGLRRDRYDRYFYSK